MAYGLWIRNYLRHPMSTGALLPSSAALGSLMTAHIQGWKGGYILELGPGMGSFTKALLQKGIPEGRLILLEQSQVLASFLSQMFPNATVIWGDAAETKKHLALLGVTHVEEIISGIPLLSFGMSMRKAICDEALSVLKPGGSFVQVTYFGRCPIPNDVIAKHSGVRRYCGVAMRNFPPGFAWRVSKP